MRGTQVVTSAWTLQLHPQRHDTLTIIISLAWSRRFTHPHGGTLLPTYVMLNPANTTTVAHEGSIQSEPWAKGGHGGITPLSYLQLILIPTLLSLHSLNFTHPQGDTTLRSILHSLLQLSRAYQNGAFGVGRARRNYSTSTHTHPHGGTTLRCSFRNFSPGLMPFFLILGPTAPTIF